LENSLKGSFYPQKLMQPPGSDRFLGTEYDEIR
jgi:hypothetical protein